MNPSLDLMKIVWGAILGLTVAVYLYTKMNIVMGGTDLVVDRGTGMIKLPSRMFKRQPRSVRIDSVRNLEIVVATGGAKVNDQPQKELILSFEESDGELYEATVFSTFTDEDSMTVVATWLEEELQDVLPKEGLNDEKDDRGDFSGDSGDGLDLTMDT